ncbi:peptidylprolyl isomerase [Actinomyces lilanjuaniae]|uniref:peptidylprolyl isomerase n=1 Tax=Actinomyces lilanjuaniae TaxID=2321394 RepID=A0ABM6Z448_9ACTO|nr:FKBP-type peptidyl-prolyl cis-trans isomerase [Actinomyces lilanjuaniae]AYD89898.1 peptidylprolyl isomerase [Actinomyces lilanjuaniae]
MRRISLTFPRALAALALVGCLTLAGCQGSADGADPALSSTTATSADPGTTSTTGGQQEPTDCSALTIDSDSSALPTVEGEAGTLPTVTWSGEEAPANLTVATLEEGDGTEVAETDLVTVGYAGWQWGSDTTFDSSYETGAQDSQNAQDSASGGAEDTAPGEAAGQETTEASEEALGQGQPLVLSLQQVIVGWRCGLAGHHVGDRVLMSVPADLAYGQDEASSGGGPTGPLVFVVEVVDTLDPQSVVGSTEDAVMEGEDELAQRGITVEGELGSPVTVSVSTDAPEPTEPEYLVLARGAGQPVSGTSTVVVNIAAAAWSGEEGTGSSTWEDGAPTPVSIATSDLDGLVGVPQGSRVVVLRPGDESLGREAVAFVMDIEAVL